MKNYVGFVNDHSGSMASLAKAAITDYNANSGAVKDAATREMLDTVVSVVGIGLSDGGYGVKRQVVISNPHVLKPVIVWPTPGGTPLFDGIGDIIELFESLPDYDDVNVSFLVMTTTDGDERHSKKYNRTTLGAKIKTLQATGRWTFVCRVPSGAKGTLHGLNIPLDNIQEWATTSEGMAQSTQATTQGINQFYAARSAGAKSSTVFYADASAVNTSALVDITSKVSLYVVPSEFNGKEIRDFILTKRMQYLKGAAFYQLTKTEARVSHTKLILIRERNNSNRIFAGKEARQMIGMPTDRNARLHPGDHGEYDIFIQSESVNRHLVAGTGVVYWEEKGVMFTQEELDKFNGNKPKAVAAPVVLPKVVNTGKPTPSPLKPVTKVAPAIVNKSFVSREEARKFARITGQSVKDQGVNTFPRWIVM